MGCVASKIHKEERVQLCKERKRLMKQLVVFRGDFADAQLAYLRALKNTGVTLRQFTESESLELENTSYCQVMPPSPPLPLPPSPPPPPPFSPDLRKSTDNHKEEESNEEESITLDKGEFSIPSPPPQMSSHWDIWDSVESSSASYKGKGETFGGVLDEENWAETKTEFEEEDPEEENARNIISNSLRQQHQPLKLNDDDSSMASWATKDTADGAMVQWRNKKTLEGIVKELDDYFLKASAGGTDIVVLMDISKLDTSLSQSFKENKRKRSSSAKVFSALSWSWSSKSLQYAKDATEVYNPTEPCKPFRKRSSSAKVFSALSWSWSSKSLQYAKDATEVYNPTEPCKPGAHSITLDKLYDAERKLYQEVKEEEMTKIELERKTMVLLKQEEENHDWTKTEKTRSIVEDLETELRRLQHSISISCSCILELIDQELYPQLVALTSGLKSMWRTMYECHQVQNHISQQLNHLMDNQSAELTSEYHRQATAQLENEVTSWYLSFCKLMESQNEYVRTLSRWIQRTNCLVDDNHQNNCSSAVRSLCEEWQLALDKLPDKIASEAIKGLMTGIRMIMVQQEEECNLHKKSEKLEKRLEKELITLAEMERKVDLLSIGDADLQSDLSPKHPVSVKRAKAEALRKRVDSEKNKYVNAVEGTRIMTLNNLKTNLPNVFQALMGFSSASAMGFEAVLSHGRPRVECDAPESSMS